MTLRAPGQYDELGVLRRKARSYIALAPDPERAQQGPNVTYPHVTTKSTKDR